MSHVRPFTLAIAVVAASGVLPASAQEAPASPWALSLPTYGQAEGTAEVTVHFPEPIERAPVTFGIPLGQVASADRIVLLDEDGEPIPADFTPLGNWEHQPARWTLVSCVLDGKKAGEKRKLALRWDQKEAAWFETPLRMRVKGPKVDVVNTEYLMMLSPRGIEAMSVKGTIVGLEGWHPGVVLKDGESLRPQDGEVRVLRDGAVCKAVRFTSTLSDALELQQEFTFYAGSPFVRCDVRYVNRSTEDIPIRSVAPVLASFGSSDIAIGLEDGKPFRSTTVSVWQDAFGWEAVAGATAAKPGRNVATGEEDTLGEWMSMGIRFGRVTSLMVVVPHFQEMAGAEGGLANHMGCGEGMLDVTFYGPRPGTASSADIRLRETMARTFTYWLVFDSPEWEEAAIARAVKAMPHVVYDRQYLSGMGVFQEHAVSHLFDEELLEAALYFKRAQVPRLEYPRCSRGADPGPDKSGEGFYEVDLHAGGMVFGETFQYFAPEPTESIIQRYHDEIGIPLDHIVTGGSCTYRNGDIVLALFQQYLRTGDRAVHDFARIHGQVFADVSVSHAPVSAGLGHYYCDWYGNPYVYQRFEGLLLGALVTGDVWWYETAVSMADYCVRAWKDGQPRDGRLTGGYGGVQYRSPYIAKMLLRLYALTGERKYADTAVRLAEWIMPVQEPEGWWRDTPGATREYRCSPIFAGYTSMGLWPLYHATKNEALRQSLMKAVDFHVGMQEDASGNNPGTFPNSYWYRVQEGSTSKTPIPEEIKITGNYATSSHWANVILQAYLATGDLDYFYSANAAWFGVLAHQTAEGGVPLSNDRDGSVWSHVMVESLPAFAAIAEERRLPIVLGPRTRRPVAAFLGKGATYHDGAFTFELKYRRDKPLPVRVYSPAGEPAEVTLDGTAIAHAYDAQTRVVRLEAPPSAEFRCARFVLRADGP